MSWSSVSKRLMRNRTSSALSASVEGTLGSGTAAICKKTLRGAELLLIQNIDLMFGLIEQAQPRLNACFCRIQLFEKLRVKLFATGRFAKVHFVHVADQGWQNLPMHQAFCRQRFVDEPLAPRIGSIEPRHVLSGGSLQSFMSWRTLRSTCS